MRNRRELGVAIVVVVISLVAAFVWIPLDTETGMVETYRRQTFIGDAFLPKVSAIAMLVAGLIQLVLVLRLKPDGAETESGLDGGIAAKELATETINTVENLICGNDRNTAASDSFDETLEEFKRHG